MDWNANQAYEPEFQTPLRKDAAYYRDRATKVLKGNYLWAVLAFVIASALGGAASGGVSFSPSVHVSENLPDHSLDSVESFGDWIEAFPIIPIMIGVFVLAFAISFVISLFVCAPMKLGYQKYQLELIDGKRPTVASLFTYYKTSLKRAAVAQLIYQLWMLLAALPMLLGTVALVVLSELVSLPLGVTVFAIGLVGSVALSIWLSYRYMYVFTILAEYPELSAADAFRNSAALMHGNKWRLFCVQFSLFGWMLLAALASTCTLGAANCFFQPYVEMLRVVFYDDLTNREAARTTEFPSLNPEDYDPDTARW